MVARMFILQLVTTIARSARFIEVEVLKILMEAVLQEEIGGKDPSTTEDLVSSSSLK
ncbi:hypothetical protein HanRHA438_Chr09g0393291 [Helianthus annuus]|nr:hypothetical protein HanHA300_Chr09g0313331 [Helianthus annuus]KAJ0541934.1 hypothetical protein HanHA89_Chr09g0334221 [Helianthus annuus]KAJ0887648.1 hypothetical protein HanRHA438_Chr09g0393291 [Helianthus annuus]